MSHVVLDTDVASRMFRHRLPGRLHIKLVGCPLTITFVTLGELTKWSFIRHWGPSKQSALHEFLQDVPVLPYSDQVARRWGELQAYAQLRGRPRPQNDTWIAACCLVRDLPLATLNRKDFEDFAEYEGLQLLDDES